MFTATTILAVKKDGHTAVAGDGQVTMGSAVVMKNTARKVRRLYHGKVIAGFAGSVADAFALFDKFEGKLSDCNEPILSNALTALFTAAKFSSDGLVSNFFSKSAK